MSATESRFDTETSQRFDRRTSTPTSRQYSLNRSLIWSERFENECDSIRLR